TDLVPGNIKSGVTIFGLTGDTNVVDTTSGTAVAADILSGKIAWIDGIEVLGNHPIASVEKTGQTGCWDAAGTVISCAGTGQDGELQNGAVWPNPRFTDNADGTVTDNLTGLIWLKNANCFGTQNWATGLSSANALADGSCGLADGSIAGDWRLPNVRELHSLIDYAYANSALSNTAGTVQWSEGDAFSAVQTTYWTSTTFANSTDSAWYIMLSNGRVDNGIKSTAYNVWPVR
ncbi:MAG: Lcl C-terminal domain-containing protein, partial [Planctomycetota bacterium]